MLKLNETNFKEEITKLPQVLVMFYREKGCSFCTKMKPIFEELNSPFIKAMYELGPTPDSVTAGLIERFPTFIAYEGGKLINKFEGVLSEEQLLNGFNPQPKQLKINEAPYLTLVQDEAALIDQIAGLKSHLNSIRDELKKRRELVG